MYAHDLMSSYADELPHPQPCSTSDKLVQPLFSPHEEVSAPHKRDHDAASVDPGDRQTLLVYTKVYSRARSIGQIMSSFLDLFVSLSAYTWDHTSLGG